MEKQSQVLKTVRLCRGGKVNACVTAIYGFLHIKQ